MPIKNLAEMVERVKSLEPKTIAVALAEDENTLSAIDEAVHSGIAKAIMFGNREKIVSCCHKLNIDEQKFEIIHHENPELSVKNAVRAVKDHQADALMKGLVNTDLFLKAVLDRENGLLPQKTVMSYVCAIEIPAYHKLLFIADTAVIPQPNLEQKIAMLKYAVQMANKFGIDIPHVALLGAAEKVTTSMSSTETDAIICQMVARKQLPACIIDGPLDLFLACDPQASVIKGIKSSINGDADILLCPSLESANIFYKSLMLFAGGELAGLIQGTTKPVIVMSRNESKKSKFYCLALSCLMAENERRNYEN